MKNQGLTFLEILMSLIIFTIAMLGYFQIFNVALDAQYRTKQEIIATNLARGLISEIMSKNFADPQDGETGVIGINAGEDINNRDTFDDVDDYDGWSGSPPVSISGSDMDGTAGGTPNYSAFTRNAEVVYCTLDSGTFTCSGAEPASDYKRATVTVSGPYVIDISINSEVKIKPTS